MAEVKIIYNGPKVEVILRGMQIAAMLVPTGSYVDSPVYTNGYPIDVDQIETAAYDQEKKYNKSIYATNVYGIPYFPGLLPEASATHKFAEFEVAALVAAEAAEKGEENKGVTFEVEGYEEELYWCQMCANMAELGFYSKVGDKEFGEAPEADETGEGGDDSGN